MYTSGAKIATDVTSHDHECLQSQNVTNRHSGFADTSSNKYHKTNTILSQWLASRDHWHSIDAENGISISSNLPFLLVVDGGLPASK
jgi:hypothetical protein